MLGFIIEDAVLRASMLERFADCPRLTVLAPLQLVSLEETADYHEIVTADGHHLRAKLVIGADGGQSWVRQAAELAVKQSDYAHTAIVTTVTTALPHQRTAWQRFLPTGPLAFLPLADAHQCSIVWSTSPAEAERLQALDHAHFQAALQAAFGDKLGAVTAIAPRHLFPLERRHVTQYVKPGLALVGDAAHTLHPLAGQGVNLGLLDVVALVDGIMTALATQRDFASLPMLRRYERGRKADNAMMQGAVGALKSLFASDNICVAALRRTGMRMTNRLPILKTFIANYATNERVELSTFMTDVKIK
jgi:2-octaprenylphenol hydroxylase